MIENKILKLESQIIEYFSKDNGATAHFEYIHLEGEKEDKVEVNVYTYNKHRNTNFLFKSSVGSSPAAALSKILKYIQENMQEENNYTVRWYHKDDPDNIQKSYFRAVDIEQVMKKFYYGKQDREKMVVDGVDLSPIA